MTNKSRLFLPVPGEGGCRHDRAQWSMTQATSKFTDLVVPASPVDDVVREIHGKAIVIDSPGRHDRDTPAHGEPGERHGGSAAHVQHAAIDILMS